ncbi:MAG: cytochrome C oxidase subunit IV family protein [bacterium]
MSHTQHEHPNYVAVWAWLLLLLFVSVGAVLLPFSPPLTVAFIFFVAAVKAGLVAVYFMHLKFEQRLIRYIAIIPVLLFIGMTISLIPDIVYNR